MWTTGVPSQYYIQRVGNWILTVRVTEAVRTGKADWNVNVSLDDPDHPHVKIHACGTCKTLNKAKRVATSYANNIIAQAALGNLHFGKGVRS